MTAKKHPHRLFDDPSASETEGFLGGIEHPAVFDPGLRQPVERSRARDAADLTSPVHSAGVTS
jgi:hypothetical protein